MNKECDVILTYCWNRVGYTILKSLHQKGLKVWAVDTSKKNICSMSKFCTGSKLLFRRNAQLRQQLALNIQYTGILISHRVNQPHTLP